MKKIILILIILICISQVYAMRNPSAVYCAEMGYEFNVEMTEQGEIGICILPNDEKVAAWDFLQGKAGQEYSYCTQEGYELKTLSMEKCPDSFWGDCAVCVLTDGTEVEITKLMNLTFQEAVCGDDFCVPGEENYQNCPQDCPGPKSNIIIIILLLLITITLISFMVYFISIKRKEQLLELQDYIMNTRSRGYTYPQIKTALIKDGYTEKQIEKAFETLRK
ncbi:DUF333 domain-containing protein [Candidatus Woesearchaeota archaeon]|nr:DUF333 domain-containing protein [Candidatus Woesearchaeota archaeon]